MAHNFKNGQIGAINAKSLTAWGELYRSHYSALCCYAEGITKRSDVAKDIVQDILVNVWSSDRKFAAMRELTFFLYKAVCNNSLYYLRTQKIHSGILADVGREVDLGVREFAETIREELLRRLYVHIEGLPAERRRIIMLSLEGHSREEIAAMLGISPNTVKAQKSSALRTLRNALDDNPLALFLSVL